MRLLLIQLPALGIQIVRLRSVLLQEAVEYFLGDFEVLAVGLSELFEELLRGQGVFVFKLRINFEPTFEEAVVAFL